MGRCDDSLMWLKHSNALCRASGNGKKYKIRNHYVDFGQSFCDKFSGAEHLEKKQTALLFAKSRRMIGWIHFRSAHGECA